MLILSVFWSAILLQQKMEPVLYILHLHLVQMTIV